jgi:Tol biopolymer transport system component
MSRVFVVWVTLATLAGCGYETYCASGDTCDKAGAAGESGSAGDAASGSAGDAAGGSAGEPAEGGSAGAGGKMEPDPEPVAPTWVVFTASGMDGLPAVYASPLIAEPAPTPVLLSPPYPADRSLSGFIVSPTRERVLYRLKDASGNDRELFLVDIVAGAASEPMLVNLPLVEPGDGSIGQAWFSADGRKVAYLARAEAAQGYDLFVVDVSDAKAPDAQRVNSERVSATESVSVSTRGPWLGHSLLYSLIADTTAAEPESELYLSNVTGSPAAPIAISSDEGAGTGSTEAWPARDGSSLVYSRVAGGVAHAFYVGGLLGETPSALTPLVGEHLDSMSSFRVTWAPDNAQLLLTASDAGTGTTELFQLEPAAATPLARAVHGALPEGSQIAGLETWSPKDRAHPELGNRVAYAVQEDGRVDLYTANLTANPSAPVLVQQHVRPGQSFCSWSPDGRWLVFTSDDGEAKNLDLYVYDTQLPTPAEGAGGAGGAGGAAGEGNTPAPATAMRVNSGLVGQNLAVMGVALAPKGSSRLYYSAEQQSKGAFGLYAVDLSGDAPGPRTTLSQGTVAGRTASITAVAADGSVFFVESSADASDLFWLPAGDPARVVPINVAMTKVSDVALVYPP